jgi:hypothetical protein
MRLRDLLALTLTGPIDGPSTGTLTIKADDAEGGGGEAEPKGDDAKEPAEDGEAADEGEPEDAEPEPKAAAGKDGKDGKAETAAQRRARLGKDPDVLALVQSQVKAASQKAVRDALAAEAAENKRKADLAAKSVEERLAAEKADAESKASTEAARAASAEMELAFYKHVVSSGLRLADPTDMPFVQQAAAKLMEAEDLDLEDALAKVATSKPHWFVPSDEETAKAAAKKKAGAKAKATTTADPKGGTEHKVEAKPKTKSVRDMSDAEFAQHRREHGIRTH